MRKLNGCQGIHGDFLRELSRIGRELVVNFNSGGSNLSTCLLVNSSTRLLVYYSYYEKMRKGRKGAEIGWMPGHPRGVFYVNYREWAVNSS